MARGILIIFDDRLDFQSIGLAAILFFVGPMALISFGSDFLLSHSWALWLAVLALLALAYAIPVLLMLSLMADGAPILGILAGIVAFFIMQIPVALGSTVLVLKTCQTDHTAATRVLTWSYAPLAHVFPNAPKEDCSQS